MQPERTAEAPFAAPLCSPITGQPARLSVPQSNPQSRRKAWCADWAIAAACGVPLDKVLSVFGVSKDGCDAYELWGKLRNVGPASLYSTQRNERWPLCWSRNLVWPQFGIVGVRLFNFEGHFVTVLNGEVFDPILFGVQSVGEWERANIGYELEDVILLSPHYLARKWRWA